MKLTIVKNVEFPKDVSDDWHPVWEAFLQMRAVGQLRVLDKADLAIPECFRILVNQAGHRTPMQHTVKEFVDLRSPIRRLRQLLQRTAISNFTSVQSHKRKFAFNEVAPACAIYNPTFVGTVVLRPRKFERRYLIERMRGSLYKTLPAQLMETMPNGNPRKFRKLSALRDMDFATMFDDKELTVRMALTQKDIVLHYEVHLHAIVPLYQRVNVALKGLWETATKGVFV